MAASLQDMLSQLGQLGTAIPQAYMQGRQLRSQEEEQALKRKALEFELEQAEAMAPWELLKAQREAIQGPQEKRTARQKDYDFYREQGVPEDIALAAAGNFLSTVQTDQGPRTWNALTQRFLSPREESSLQGMATSGAGTTPTGQAPTDGGVLQPVEQPTAEPTGPKTALQLEQERRAEEKANRPGQPGYVIALNPETEEPITYSKPINISDAENKEIREIITTHHANQQTLHSLMDQIHENPVRPGDRYIPSRRANAMQVAGKVKQLYFAVKDLEEMGALTDADIAMLEDMVPDPTKLEDSIYEWIEEGTLTERLKQFEEFLAKRVNTVKKAYGIEGYEPKTWQPPSKEDEEQQETKEGVIYRPKPQDPNTLIKTYQDAYPDYTREEIIENLKRAGELPPDYVPQEESAYQEQSRTRATRSQRGGAVATNQTPVRPPAQPNTERSSTRSEATQVTPSTPTPEQQDTVNEVAKATPSVAQPTPEQDPIQEAVSLLRNELDRGVPKKAIKEHLDSMKADGIITQREYVQIMRELQLGTYSEPLATERLRGGRAR